MTKAAVKRLQDRHAYAKQRIAELTLQLDEERELVEYYKDLYWKEKLEHEVYSKLTKAMIC